MSDVRRVLVRSAVTAVGTGDRPEIADPTRGEALYLHNPSVQALGLILHSRNSNSFGFDWPKTSENAVRLVTHATKASPVGVLPAARSRDRRDYLFAGACLSILLHRGSGLDAHPQHPHVPAHPQLRENLRPAGVRVAVAGFSQRPGVESKRVFGALRHPTSMQVRAPRTSDPRRRRGPGRRPSKPAGPRRPQDHQVVLSTSRSNASRADSRGAADGYRSIANGAPRSSSSGRHGC